MSNVKTMQKLPNYDANAVLRIFRAKIREDMTPEERTELEAAYTEAMLKDRDKHYENRKQIAEENTQFFLENPVSAIMQMYSENDMWYIGEILNIYGIGNTTMKRFGKGTFVGKGTMGEGTISQFHMTATIGNQVMQEDTGCRNDRHSKNEAQRSTLGLLGSRIITDYIKGHPERSAEIEPIRYKLSHI